MADRLLDVDVLARLAGPDRHERVPVIGRRNRHGVDIPIVEDATEIRLRLRIPAPPLLHEGQRRFEMPLVDVHDVGDADVGDAGQVLVVILAPAAGGPGRMPLVVAADADDRDVDGLVRALRARPRAGNAAANPTVAAAVFDRNKRRFIMAVSPFRDRMRSVRR